VINIAVQDRRSIMTRKTAMWLLVVAVIVLVLGGASMILEQNAGPRPDVPTGFLH